MRPGLQSSWPRWRCVVELEDEKGVTGEYGHCLVPEKLIDTADGGTEFGVDGHILPTLRLKVRKVIVDSGIVIY